MNYAETMTGNAERSLLSCLRDEDEEAYKSFAYAIEQGITIDHFLDEGCKAYWNSLIQAEKEGEFGSLGVLQRLPKTFNDDHPYFHSSVLSAHEVPSVHKAIRQTDNLSTGGHAQIQRPAALHFAKSLKKGCNGLRFGLDHVHRKDAFPLLAGPLTL